MASTTLALAETQTVALAAGYDDHLTKPFTEEILFRKMVEHLGVNYAYAEKPQDPTGESYQSMQLSLPVEVLADLPQEWVVALYRAPLLCEQKAVKQLLQQIPVEHRRLQRGLDELTQKFDFQQIIHLTKPDLNGESVP